MFKKIKNTYYEFPSNFWTLISSLFIDRLGGALLFPFFALYITQRFNVGMTEVGWVFTIHVTASMIGGMFGGALTDKFGRKTMVLYGLIVSGTSSLLMGFIPNFHTFIFFTFIIGLVGNIGGPATQAMIADILPESKRVQGFGILRVVMNLSVTFGPIIGGILAGIDYMLLFVTDFITSLITAAIVFIKLPETKPKSASEKQGLLETIINYKIVFLDKIFMAFLVLTLLTATAYIQMHTTLPVYLRDFYNVSPQGYGYILSLNAAMVVLFQFWITKKTSSYPPLLLMIAGNIFYAAGLGLYGFVSSYSLFLLAMVIITTGEMINAPVMQALIVKIAPEDMRGRYMAVFGLHWGIASAFGPLAAGLVMDNFNPNWVWYACGIVCSIAAFGYLLLHRRVGGQFNTLLGKKKLEASEIDLVKLLEKK